MNKQRELEKSKQEDELTKRSVYESKTKSTHDIRSKVLGS